MIKKVLHFFKLHSYPNAHIDVIRFCMFAVRLFSNMLPYTFSIALKLACLLASHVYEITFVPLKSKWSLYKARHTIFQYKILNVCSNGNKTGFLNSNVLAGTKLKISPPEKGGEELNDDIEEMKEREMEIERKKGIDREEEIKSHPTRQHPD